jgi:HEPN domain-containing protein
MSVPRWNKGSEVVERLLASGHLQRVPADAATVESLLTSARRHIASATATAEGDPEGAYALAYDGARKTATALLAHQGLRPTTVGGHIVIVETVTAQFPSVPGLKSIDRLRRRRNQSEYPEPSTYDPVTTEEADEAIVVAGECISTATRLIEAPQLGIF